MGTAASITLVLQTFVPEVALSGARISLDLIGGTDVPWSPTFDYFEVVVSRALAEIGIKFEASAPRRGYYPRGGGKVRASVEPCTSLVPLDFMVRPGLSEANICSRCGSLPRHVAERQLNAASAVLEKSGFKVRDGQVGTGQTESPGSSILAYSTGKGHFLGTDGIGAKGKSAEKVGEDAARRFVAAAGSGACLDSNLADMVLPLLSLAPGASRVRIPEVTAHLKSGLLVAGKFTSSISSIESGGKSSIVTITPDGAK
jgi:RNA 3'-terminal phosphate cyclase (ATP)